MWDELAAESDGDSHCLSRGEMQLVGYTYIVAGSEPANFHLLADFNV